MSEPDYGKQAAAAELESILLTVHESRKDELEEQLEELNEEIEMAEVDVEDEVDGAKAALEAARQAKVDWLAEFGDELKTWEGYAPADPLSIEVRSRWYTPGEDPGPAEEYRLVLSTGGPHTELRGELDNGQPITAELYYQDWNTPFTNYWVKADQATALVQFAERFNYGE